MESSPTMPEGRVPLLASPVAPAREAPRRRAVVAPFSLFLLASALLPLALFAFAAWQDWRGLIDETRARVGSSVDAIAEHALRVLKTQELAAAHVAERLKDVAALDPDALARTLAGETAALPDVEAIAILDAAGTVVGPPGPLPAGPGALAERAFFRRLAAGDRVAIGGRIGGIDGPILVAVPRRDAQEAFAGAVVLALSPAGFRSFYRDTFPTRGSVGLIHREGAVLVREPEAPGSPLTMLPHSPFFDLIARRPRGVEQVATAVSGRTIELGYAQVGALPVYAFYAVSQEDLWAAWRERFARMSLYFAPAASLLAALAFFAWRSHGRLEETVAMRTGALSRAIEERDLLLREVHHRVKNNMQIISSMIRLQDRVGTAPSETVRRIHAMAMVHELAYAASGPVSEIDLAAYAERLCAALAAGDPRRGVRFALNLEPIRLDLERAMPFALILSEAATNACRHAYPDGVGVVEVVLRRTGEGIELRVHDEGRGFNPEVDGRGGFGLTLIRNLSLQLDAEYRYERDPGTRFVLTFPLATPTGSAGAA